MPERLFHTTAEVYAAPGSAGRPTTALPDGLVRERLLAYREPDGSHLMPHHIDALEPHVRLAIDAAASYLVPNEGAPRGVTFRPGSTVNDLAADVTDALRSARYWSAIKARIRSFDNAVLAGITRTVVFPLAERIVRSLEPAPMPGDAPTEGEQHAAA